MNKTKKIIFGSILLIGAAVFGMVLFYTFSNRGPIYAFDEKRDMQDILNIMHQDRYWLFANEDSSPEFILKNRAPNEDIRYFGNLVIKVYREKNKFVGFTAYYMKTEHIGLLLFIAVQPEFRGKGKGYAERLMRYALNELKQMGAEQVTLCTRTDNIRAQSFYRRIGFYEISRDDGFVYFAYDQK